MQKCSGCGAETKLHVGGVPLCPKCEEKQKITTDTTKEPKSEQNLKRSTAKG